MLTAIVSAIAVATGTTAALGTAAALTALSDVIGVGLSIDLSYAANALFGQQPSSPRPQDVSSVISQSVSARTRHYGRVRAGGSVVFVEIERGTLNQFIVYSEGLIDAYERFYIDNTVYTLSGGTSGMALEAPQNSRGFGITTLRGSSTQGASRFLWSGLPATGRRRSS